MKQLVGDRWAEGEHIRICSENNFPTAAGLASSAAGFACFAYALCNLFGITNLETISTIARSGSGSACRSVYGGFVQWVAGHSNDTSIARQIVDEHHWPQMRVLILVVKDTRKDISSTLGMKQTAETSTFINERATVVVPQRTAAMIEALRAKDFATFAKLTMMDSNSFHSVCQDTYPPIRYMNDISWLVVNLVHFFNDHVGEPVAAYTFDAGPNACLYLRAEYISQILGLVQAMFPREGDIDDQPLEIKGIAIEPTKLDAELAEYAHRHQQPNALKYVISTKIGTGPEILSQNLADDVSLLSSSDGLPKSVK